jgi:hypothetical protein
LFPLILIKLVKFKLEKNSDNSQILGLEKRAEIFKKKIIIKILVGGHLRDTRSPKP